jgi:hypothetical protein
MIEPFPDTCSIDNETCVLLSCDMHDCLTSMFSPPALDHLRIKWSAADILEGRPALSRWHPEWKFQFEEYIKENLFEVNGQDCENGN